MPLLYVGNLSFQATESELSAAFSAHGEVVSTRIIRDRPAGRSQGFAFVDMKDRDAAVRAAASMNQREWGGRPLRVSIMRPGDDRARIS